MNELVLEKKANNFRSEHGLTAAEPIRLKSLLQKLNIITLFQPLSNGFSGMAVKLETTKRTDRFMLINTCQSLGKQHFTICHELYHLYIQQSFSSRVCNTGQFNKRDKEEYSADIFASFLLLPTEGILSNIPDKELQQKEITLPTLLHIEQLYSCSRRALLFRLKKMSFISPQQYEDWSLQIKRGALEHGYQTDIYEPGNNGVALGDYGTLARQLFNADEISENHYYQLLADFGIDLTKPEENGPFE